MNTEHVQVRMNNIEVIEQAVAYFFGMPVEDLHQKGTTRAVTVPRQIAMYLAKHMTDASLPEIGRHFGGKHHTTVMHAIAKVEERRRREAGVAATISALVKSIRG
jgi:chromosomal replication initiator protein